MSVLFFASHFPSSLVGLNVRNTIIKRGAVAVMLQLGQKVIVRENRSGHGFEIGEEIIVESIDNVFQGEVGSFRATNGKEHWYLAEWEVEK